MENKPRINRLAGLSTLAAILTCYGTIALIGILSLLGITLAVNPTAQAGVTSFFAILAAVVILFSARLHRVYGPSLVGAAGAGLVLWVMWGNYNWLVELTGFAALIGATYWDWRARKSCTV